MRRMNPWAFAYLIKGLETEMDCLELAGATGLSRLTVYYYCKALHQVGMVHISDYHKDIRGRNSIRVFKLGPGKDVRQPKLQAARRGVEYRARLAQLKMLRALAGVSA